MIKIVYFNNYQKLNSDLFQNFRLYEWHKRSMYYTYYHNMYIYRRGKG